MLRVGYETDSSYQRMRHGYGYEEPPWDYICYAKYYERHKRRNFICAGIEHFANRAFCAGSVGYPAIGNVAQSTYGYKDERLHKAALRDAPETIQSQQ